MNFNWGRHKNKPAERKRTDQPEKTARNPADLHPQARAAGSWGITPGSEAGTTTLEEWGPTELSFVASFTTDVGSVRNQNQDAGLAASSGNSAILLVADGMGGHAGGAEASHVAVDWFAEIISSLEPGEAPDAEEAFRSISELVTVAAPKGGTTLVMTFVDQDCIHAWHVGDSRAYLYREGALRRLTTDHSWVQNLVSTGRITEAEAAVHPRRNVLTRAIGAGHDPSPDHVTVRVLPYDLVLLCSDGLHGVLGEDGMQEVLRDFNFHDKARLSQELERVSALLVRRANRQGGPDNISVAMALAIPT